MSEVQKLICLKHVCHGTKKRCNPEITYSFNHPPHLHPPHRRPPLLRPIDYQALVSPKRKTNAASLTLK